MTFTEHYGSFYCIHFWGKHTYKIHNVKTYNMSLCKRHCSFKFKKWNITGNKHFDICI